MHVCIYVGIHIVVGWNKVMALYVVLGNSGAIYVSMYDCVYACIHICMYVCIRQELTISWRRDLKRAP